MSGVLTSGALRGATRLYTTLTFLQWLPVGLTMAPFVLLVLDRGYSLAEVSLLGAVAALTVALLELPTGGLADTYGRRPVLVTSALAHAAGLLVLGLASAMPLLLLSSVLLGLARALASGPLEAWYVDTVHAQGAGEGDRSADLTTGLARGEATSSVALAVGTVTGGLLPLLVAAIALPVEDLAAPVLLAAAVELVRAVASARLSDAPRPRGPGIGALREVPRTIAGGLGLVARDRVLLRLLTVAATTGVALAVVELVTPAWIETVTGEPRRAALTYAVIITVGFAADAAGAAVAPRVRRRTATAAGAAGLATGGAVAAVAALVLATSLDGWAALLVAGAAYVTLFAGLGAAGPPLGELLHGQVTPERRATMLSVQSLTLQAAGAGGAVVAGVLTTRLGAWAGAGLALVSLVVAVAVLLRIRAR